MSHTRMRAPGSLLAVLAVTLTAAVAILGPRAEAQAPGPSLLDPKLSVRTVVSGLVTPTSMAFLGRDDMLVLEKQTGKVQRVTHGTVQTVLDLAVNNASERGLLGIALHPDFENDADDDHRGPGRGHAGLRHDRGDDDGDDDRDDDRERNRHAVYLYWTCASTHPVDPFMPTERECPDMPGTGADTGDLLAVPLLGNRIDRFIWDGSTLTFDRNLIKLHAFQNDATNGVPRGNHNGGVLRFGPDKKLYLIFGDNGRRGQMQNLVDGPFGPGQPDDQFGGPEPDDAHFTGVILRLNDDGSAPKDNPFFREGERMGGEVGANIQKIFAYGVRNSFGIAFDPVSGRLWDEQNSDDAFDELNQVEPGSNLGWVQIMGPASRIAQFKAIETGPPPFFGLQQNRWPPTNIADTPQEAMSRLFVIPGSHYSDPEFSWKFAVAPAGIGFLSSRALGSQYRNDLFVGAARTNLEGGYLFRFKLTGNRRKIAVDDPRLQDRVADNNAKFDITESESLLFGRNFGIGTDIQTGPNGNLFVVSLSNGAVYEVFRTADRRRGPSRELR
jgi:glucose/arabinose dehydrogenase